MIYMLPEYQRVWAVALAPCSDRGTQSRQCQALTQDLRPPSALPPTGRPSTPAGRRCCRTLLPRRQSRQGLLRGRGRDNRWGWRTASPWAPRSFNANCGKGHRNNTVWRRNAEMCKVQSSAATQGFSQVLWGSRRSTWHSPSSFFFLLILMPSSHQTLKRCLSSYYGRRRSLDVPSSKAKPNQSELPESLYSEHAFSATEVGDHFRK